MEKKVPLGRMFSVILETIRAYINRELKEDHVDSSEFSILMYIYMYGEGLSQEELTNLLVIDRAAISRAIKKLVDKGYIERIVNPQDKRAFMIFLTESGRQLDQRISEVYDHIFHLLTEGISREDVYYSMNTLEAIFENAQEMRRKL